jgi:hypothetical protein
VTSLTPTILYRAKLEARRRITMAASAAITRSLLDPDRIDATWPAWAVQQNLVVEAAHTAAFNISTNYFSDLTRAETGQPPDVVPIRPAPNPERELAILRMTGAIAPKRTAATGAASDVVLARAQSATLRYVSTAAHDRSTDVLFSEMTESEMVVAYRRIVRAGACKRCQLMAGRRYSVTPSPFSGHLPAGYFRRHPRCTCTAEPVYGRRSRFEKPRPIAVDLVSQRAPLLDAA